MTHFEHFIYTTTSSKEGSEKPFLLTSASTVLSQLRHWKLNDGLTHLQ